MNRRMIIITNRGPFVITGDGDDAVRERSVSGLVTALEPFLQQRGGQWIAWSGRTAVAGEQNAGEEITVEGGRYPYTFREVLLTPDEIDGYYNGLANGGLWPLSHCFIDRCHFDTNNWESYVAVNRRFAQQSSRMANADDLLWVHDYHLALVPQFLREYSSGRNYLAFFWHIPFPPLDVLRVMPWAADILKGMLGSDLIAFHTKQYVDHFLNAAVNLLGLAVDYHYGIVYYRGRKVQVRALPMGVDWPAISRIAEEPGVRNRAQRLRQTAGVKHILLGVDRLDYTKGIVERLQAFELFLSKYPEYQGEIILMQVAVPSREEVTDYQSLRKQVEETVGRINGRFGQGWYVPVHYYHRGFDLRRLMVLYQTAHVALVSPLRDGLNLVAKEFVAARVNEEGVLLLSQFAGVAEELEEAVIINPYNLEQMADQIKYALEMPREQQQIRMRALRKRVKEHDLTWWLAQFSVPWAVAKNSVKMVSGPDS